MPDIRKLNSLDVTILLVTISVYVVHALLYGDWIIDDAGISFVYARNLADGFGLVSQPGRMPVEGYSNPTWVFLMAPFFFFGIFDPVLTPKFVSIVLVASSFVLFYVTLGHLSVSRVNRSIILFLVAINTPFVVWTSSGLENPLYVLFILLLFTLMAYENSGHQRPIWIGAIAGLIALTRPDGMIFFLMYLVWVFLTRRDTTIKELATSIIFFCFGVALSFAPYFIFRVMYFGDILPNTYYAKVADDSPSFLSIAFLVPFADVKLLDLIGSMFNLLRMWAFIIIGSATVYLFSRGEFKRNFWLVGIFLFWTTSIYMLLPTDWMGEYRFATPFYPFFYAYVIITSSYIIGKLPIYWSRLVGFFFASLLITLSITFFLPRSISFADTPTVAFDRIKDQFGIRFNTFADDLSLEDASLLAPDLGGTLYYSNLTIYDLAGLTDRTIARAMFNDDNATLRDYIFDELQPTFIRLHGVWTSTAQLIEDPRLNADYLTICSLPDSFSVSDGGDFISGIFIRGDALNEDNMDAFVLIQETVEC